MDIDEDHSDDCKPTEEDIQSEIERLGLTNKSIEYLRREIAEVSLENKILQVRLAESERRHRSSVLDILRLQHGSSSKTLDRGIVRNAATRLQSRGGSVMNHKNEQVIRRREILDAAKKDIESGLLKHGGKEEWIKNKLKEERYKDQGFSIKTLKDDIKF